MSGMTLNRRKMLRLRKRHGSYCHLCGGYLDFHKKWPSLDAPTLDHLVPKSQGGGNETPNLRLAHNRCNQARGNGDLADYRPPAPSHQQPEWCE